MDQSNARRPGTAPLKRAIRCTKEGLFVPNTKSADVATVTAFLNTLATDIHSQRAVGLRDLAEISAIVPDNVRSGDCNSSVAALGRPPSACSHIHTPKQINVITPHQFRANRKQTHSAVSMVPVEERIREGAKALALGDVIKRNNGIALCNTTLPDAPPCETLLDRPSKHTARDVAALKHKDTDWLVFWGNVTKLGDEMSAMIDKLALSETEGSRLRSEVSWLNERLSRCSEDFKELQLAIISEEERHRHMILIERDKYNALKSDLNTMSAMVADMRRKVASAEAAVASAHADIDGHLQAEKELRRAMVAMNDDHAIELLAQKEALAAELEMDKKQKKRLEALEKENKALTLRVDEQQKVIDQLTKERGSPANSQAAGASFLKKFENQLDPSTVKTFMKFARTQGDVVERLAVLSTSSEKAVKTAKQLKVCLSNRTASLEKALMAQHDTQSQFINFEGVSDAFESHRSSSSAAGSNLQKYDSTKLIISVPPTVPNDGVAWRQLGSESSLRSAYQLYKELMFQNMPKGVGAMADTIHYLWQELAKRVPHDAHMPKGGDRERIHQKAMALLAPTHEAWKGAHRCHTAATDLLVSAEVANKELATKMNQAAMSLANAEQDAKFKQLVMTTDSASLSLQVKTLEEKVRGYESLLRLGMTCITEAVTTTKFQLNVVSPIVSAPPADVCDIFPTYITAEGVHQLTNGTPLAFAHTAYLVDDLCNAVRYEHQKQAKHLSGSGGAFAVSNNEYLSEIELLKAKCVRAEKAMSESHSELQKAREECEKARREAAKRPTLSGIDVSSLRHTSTEGSKDTSSEVPSDKRRVSTKGIARSQSVSVDNTTATTFKDTATQCTLLPLRNRIPPNHIRVPAHGESGTTSITTPTYKLSRGASNPLPLETSLGTNEVPLTSQSSLFTVLKTDSGAVGSLSSSTSPKRVPHPLVAASSNYMSKYHIVNNTGQEDALYYQLQRLQRNGGVHQSLSLSDQSNKAKGRRAVGRAAMGSSTAPDTSSVTRSSATSSNGFMQVRGLR